jgi:glycosyltransferase involved in cell wall biosynthesis
VIPLLVAALQVLAWSVALLWLWKAVTSSFGLRRVPDLTESKYDLTPLGKPSITVIVPARNESTNVAACLQSLLDQQYPDLQIVAIDDRSTDSTGGIMDSLAVQNPSKLSVIHITELPAGWLGKTHAMALAARSTIALHRPDYLLFTDADILFRADALRVALAHAVATSADHLVILPTTLVKTPGEGMLLAYLQVMSLWAVRPWRISDPKALRDAVGVGAFNLIRTPVYEQIGGFESVRMEIVEDLTIGRRIKRAGFRQRVATAPNLLRVHWASGLVGILNGMTKNLFAVFQFRVVLLLIASVWITVFCISPAILVFIPQTRMPAALTLASVAFLHFLSSRQSKVSPWFAPLFPVSAVLIVYSLFRSLVITINNRGVTWRGTFYPLAELRKRSTPPA